MKRPVVVLNTRPRDQAAELTALLRRAGCEPLEQPAIEIVPAWQLAELQRVRDDLQRRAYAWLVLQSVNAGRLLPLQHARILCGMTTARALHIQPAVSLERFSAAGALDSLRPVLRGGERVLIPRAAESRDELLDGLADLDVLVDAPVAYRTEPTSPATLEGLRALSIDVLTLCSPSAARALLAGIGRDWLAERRIVCLGETTAHAVRVLGLHVDGVAKHTSMPSLVEAVLGTLEVAV
jgi:uroporphyrinogen-III synthase